MRVCIFRYIGQRYNLTLIERMLSDRQYNRMCAVGISGSWEDSGESNTSSGFDEEDGEEDIRDL